MTNRDYEAIIKGYKGGIFKILRLTRINAAGEREVIVSFNKKQDEHTFEEKLRQIRYMLENNLPPGNYQVEAKNSIHPNSALRIFKVEVKVAKTNTLLHQAESSNGTKIENAEIFDGMTNNELLEKYLELTNECANLRAQCAVKDIEIKILNERLEWFSKQNINPNTGLSDPSTAGSVTNSLGSTLKDIAQMGIPILEKYFDQRDRELTLKENSVAKNGHSNTKSSYPGAQRQTFLNQLLAEYGRLFDENPEECDNKLDDLKEKDLQAYNYIMKGLNLEEEEEEGEEQQ